MLQTQIALSCYYYYYVNAFTNTINSVPISISFVSSSTCREDAPSYVELRRYMVYHSALVDHSACASALALSTSS